MGFKEQKLPDIDTISIDGSFVVHVQCKADSQMLRMEADSNLLPSIYTEINNGKLLITPISSICTDNPIKINLQVSSLKRLFSDGANDIRMACNDSKELFFELNGATDLQLGGNGVSLDLRIEGGSTFDGGEAAFEKVKVHASDAATALVFPQKFMKVSVSDAAEVFYTPFSGELIKDIQDAGDIAPTE